MENLKNKRIFYLGPVYFYYDKYLIHKLKKLGAEVDTFELNLNLDKWKYKLQNKLNPESLQLFSENYYNSAFEKNGYDYVLVRQGNQLPLSFFTKLKEINSKAIFINFHWDSIKPGYDYTHNIKIFDKVFSFDYKDCEENKELIYLPLFHIDEYSNFNSNKKNKEYDVLFIGSWRDEERYNLITQTDLLCKEVGLNFFYYLHLSYKEQYVLLKKGKIAKKAKGKSLSYSQILKFFSLSNTIIDFPSSFQTGLTMRTFETLGAGKKLITSNANIIKEPFYDPDYIDIIDLNNFKINTDFIRHKPKNCIKSRMKDYSIESYINKLFK